MSEVKERLVLDPRGVTEFGEPICLGMTIEADGTAHYYIGEVEVERDAYRDALAMTKASALDRLCNIFDCIDTEKLGEAINNWADMHVVP